MYIHTQYENKILQSIINANWEGQFIEIMGAVL